MSIGDPAMASVFDVLQEQPDKVFGLAAKGNEFNDLIKSLLDPIVSKYSVLDEIYTDGLDASQVFGQSKMVLDGVGQSMLGELLPELKGKYRLGGDHSDEDEDDGDGDEDEDDEEEALGDQVDDEEQAEEVSSDENDFSGFVSAEEDLESEDGDQDEVEDQEDQEDDQEDENEEDDSNALPVDAEGIRQDAFGLNDGFFDIDEYNKQVQMLENNDGDVDDSEVDMFGEISDGESDEDGMEYYDDFFDKKGKVKTRKSKVEQPEGYEQDEVEEADEGDEEEYYDAALESARLDMFADDEEDEEQGNEEESTNLSSFEKQQLKLQKEIEKLEAELVADKKWTMKGEVKAKDRPMDSLLNDEEAPSLEFDRTSKPVPVITEEVTETLEDIIRRRIANNQFDDLQKRFITDVASFHKQKKVELSGEKSAKSLAEIYEDDVSGAANDEADEKLKQQHDEISDLYTKLTHKLDTLCSAHFIPKPHQFKQIEIAVSDNTASINMEDSQPLHVSSESTLAPQEIYKIGDDKVKAEGVRGRSEVQLKSGLSYSKEELSREEKQRLRRAAKRKRSRDFNERQALSKQKEGAQKKEEGGKKKRAKTSEVIDTLSKGNVTVVDAKGQLRDVKGNLKKDKEAARASNLKM